MNKRYALFAGGYSEAEEFLNYVKTKYGNDAYNDIAFILTEIDASNHPYLLDKPIKSLSTCNLADVMLLVACPVYEYMQLAARFRSKGMEEFTDFKWYKFYDKKVCLINANCHGPWIKAGLITHPAFSDTYAIHPHLAFSEGMPQGMHTPLADDTLRNVDLLLTQHMKSDNTLSATYADENVLSKISDSTKVIFIPNFYAWGTGIYQTQNLKIINGWKGDSGFYDDELLDLAYQKVYRRDIKSIWEFIQTYEMDATRIHEKFEQMVEHLKQREKRWNIKIVDWMVQNYGKTPIYLDLGHPTSIVMWLVCKGILYLLGIQQDDSLRQAYENEYYMGLGGIIPPCVAETLKISYADTVPIKRYNHDFTSEAMEIADGGEMRGLTMSHVQFLRDYYLLRFNEILPYEQQYDVNLHEEDIVAAYRLFLGRLPENIDAVNNLKHLWYIDDLRRYFVQSEEFRQFYERVTQS